MPKRKAMGHAFRRGLGAIGATIESDVFDKCLPMKDKRNGHSPGTTCEATWDRRSVVGCPSSPFASRPAAPTISPEAQSERKG